MIPKARDNFLQRFVSLGVLRGLLAEAGFSDHDTFVPVDAVCQGKTYFDGRGPLTKTWRDGDSIWELVDDQELAHALELVPIHISPLTYSIDISNCTIAGNRSINGNGGGLRITGLNVSIRNSVLWGNTHGGPASPEECGQLCGPYETTIDSSCVQDWAGIYQGENNFATPPNFVDDDGPDDDPSTWDDNNYRISFISPCIDAANNALVPADALDLDGDENLTEQLPFDLDGNLRFVNDPNTKDTGIGDPPIVDMGAYEFQGIDCPWDLNDSGSVDTSDLLALFAQWGTDGPADFDGSGSVDTSDLLILFANWGSCP